MKQFLAAVVIAVSLTPSGAFAQERVGDAALGGLSGALVFGPGVRSLASSWVTRRVRGSAVHGD
jgi:hypothetical protein